MHVLTLPEYDVKKCWLNSADKQLEFINQKTGKCFLIPVQNVCGVLVAPSRDLAGAMEILQACMRIIWFCSCAGGPDGRGGK